MKTLTVKNAQREMHCDCGWGVGGGGGGFKRVEEYKLTAISLVVNTVHKYDHFASATTKPLALLISAVLTPAHLRMKYSTETMAY